MINQKDTDCEWCLSEIPKGAKIYNVDDDWICLVCYMEQI